MAEVKNYKRKPVVVQAIQFTGNNFDDLENFSSLTANKNDCYTIYDVLKNKHLIAFDFHTEEGKVQLKEGDYLVKGIDNRPYPCNQEVFESIYEETDLPYKIGKDFIEPFKKIQEEMGGLNEES
jgi:hypothetical protein